MASRILDADLGAPIRPEPFFNPVDTIPKSKPPSAPKKKTMGVKELEDIVRRLSLMLAYYQEKYPNVNVSTLGHDVFESTVIPDVKYAIMHPLFKAYEDRLAETESALNSLTGDIGKVTSKTKDLLGENERVISSIREEFESKFVKTQVEIQSLTENIEILRQENGLLLDEQKMNEENIEKAFSLQKSIPLLQNHISSLRQLSTTQSETITTYSISNATFETKLSETLDRLQVVTTRNKDLSAKCLAHEKKLGDLSDKVYDEQKEKERLTKWKKEFAGIVEDWEACVQGLGLTQLLGDNCLVGDKTHFFGVLQTHIKRVQKQLSETQKLLSSKTKESETLQKENTTLLQRFILEIEKKDGQVEATKSNLEKLTHSMDQIRHERDSALNSASHTARENGVLGAKLKEVLTKKDYEMAEIVSNSNHKLKAVRERFEEDRQHYQIQVDTLTQSKLELQCEVGSLLRDKRAAEFELEEVVKNQEIQRDRFRRDLGLKL